ncbi:MAG: tail fiber domain-containing protein, partial [Verrucomicrobia bacterium]|nr:tail fiber domain-containing protein [Verrucomicrobiota bacterium]
NGNLAVGTDYNTAAPANGALIEGITGIGTTSPDSANSFLTVASTGQSNLTLLAAPASKAPNIRSGIFFGGSYFQCTDSPSNGTKDLTFFNIPTQTNVLTLAASNSVGIGTTKPTQAGLVVATSVTGSISSGEFFNFNSGPELGSFGTASGSWSIYAVGGIAASGDIVSQSNIVSVTNFNLSDARLKNVIGRSNSGADLTTLEKLDVTDYTMKDARFSGRKFKKLIAQQVEQVYPEAVTKVTDAVPDIYSVGQVKKISDGLCEISTDKEFSLKSGERVEILGPDRLPHVVIAENVSDKSFSAKLEGLDTGTKVFVYGHEVNDLRTLDYEAISMLNVSATQELAKRVETLEQQNSNLQNEAKRLTAIEAEQGCEIAALRAANEKFNALASENANLKAEMEALKKAVTTIQQKENSEVRTVVLEQ